MSVNPDDLVQFCELTGSDPQIAQGYLEIADGNVQQAVELFFVG